MGLFDQNSPGLLGKASQWMTPERAIAMQGLGMAFSQLGAGQPVDLSPAHAALAQRQERAQSERMLKESGLLNKFTPEQQAILAQMPPAAAQQIIAKVLFAPPKPPNLQEINGQLVDLDTRQVVGDYRTPDTPDPVKRAVIVGPNHPRRAELGLPDDGKSYEVTFEGDTPVDFSVPGGAGTTITNNLGPTGIDYGDPGSGLVWQRDDKGNVVTDKRGAPIAIPYQGGPAWQDQQSAETKSKKAAGLASAAGDVVTIAAARARQANAQRSVDGVLGQVASLNPESANAEVYRQVEALKSMAAVENINAMRAASPNGGALGQASDADIRLLKDKSGALDPASKHFERDLADYERTLLRTIYGPELGDEVFEATREMESDGLTAEEKQFLGLE